MGEVRVKPKRKVSKCPVALSILDRFLVATPAEGSLLWNTRVPSDFDSQNPEKDCRVWNKRFAGRNAARNAGRYLRVSINRKQMPAHHVMWYLHYGEWPSRMVDHINGDGKDNRISNLRLCTLVENNRNKAPTGQSPYKGVSFRTAQNTWIAGIKGDDGPVFLGSFETEIEAALAYDAAAQELHGEFARLNFTAEQKRRILSALEPASVQDAAIMVEQSSEIMRAVLNIVPEHTQGKRKLLSMIAAHRAALRALAEGDANA